MDRWHVTTAQEQSSNLHINSEKLTASASSILNTPFASSTKPLFPWYFNNCLALIQPCVRRKNHNDSQSPSFGHPWPRRPQYRLCSDVAHRTSRIFGFRRSYQALNSESVLLPPSTHPVSKIRPLRSHLYVFPRFSIPDSTPALG
jgi:hypothetical protein